MSIFSLSLSLQNCIKVVCVNTFPFEKNVQRDLFKVVNCGKKNSRLHVRFCMYAVRQHSLNLIQNNYVFIYWIWVVGVDKIFIVTYDFV